MSADRNILARQKGMCAEPVTGFIVIILDGIVFENPACVLCATGLVHEMTDFVVLASPKPSNPAVVAILLPEDWVDMSFGIEGRNKMISMA